MTLKSPWQEALSNVITDADELCKVLQLDPAELITHHPAVHDFPLRVPRDFVARMEVGNVHDPLLRQVLPRAEEAQITPGYAQDPLQEKNANPLPGLLHKYHGRVLFLVAGSCAINCRYCFRRHFPYEENAPGTAGWDAALRYIENDPTISEVIYSGGDPLLMKDELLASLTQKIAAIPHVTTLRIHTRLPIVIPERVSEALIHWLTSTRLNPVVVVHCNHANEIDSAVVQAIQALRKAGVVVLNQSVLLRGVNDEANALIALSQRLFSAGALPYYVHMLDPVQGTAHFAVSVDEAKKIMLAVSHRLPGYLVPKLVWEKAGELAKCRLF